jgi:hypothetical protein
MGRLCAAFVSVFALIAWIPVAWSDEAKDLLFFSGNLMSGRSFGGVGWLHAASGLDLSGPVFSVELGRQQFNQAYGQATAGWRFSQPGLSFTLVGGAELTPSNGPAVRPLASADLWWEPAKSWMTTAEFQATPAYVSWRLAVGLKSVENWPWIGPEVAATTGELHAGVHATGLRLGNGFEARASTGVSWRCGRVGPYGELSVWRRF